MWDIQTNEDHTIKKKEENAKINWTHMLNQYIDFFEERKKKPKCYFLFKSTKHPH